MNKPVPPVENTIPNLEQKQSPIKWAIMIALPFLVFFISMFLGRYDVSPLEVLKIFANTTGVINATLLKWGWIADYALPISLIAGMASAIPITGWLG